MTDVQICIAFATWCCRIGAHWAWVDASPRPGWLLVTCDVPLRGPVTFARNGAARG